jgi:hypothetical protein
MKSGVHQGSVSGSLLFNAFINDICNSIRNLSNLLFADNPKIFRNIKNVGDCKSLLSGIDYVQTLCLGSGLKLNLGKIRFLFFTRKPNSIAFT